MEQILESWQRIDLPSACRAVNSCGALSPQNFAKTRSAGAVVALKVVNDQLASRNVTRIVVAHRPHTIAAADRVFALRDGRLMEQQNPFKAPQAAE